MKGKKQMRTILAWVLAIAMTFANVEPVSAAVLAEDADTFAAGTGAGEDATAGDISEGDVTTGDISGNVVTIIAPVYDAGATLAAVDSGTVNGITWAVTEDGVLTLGGTNTALKAGSAYWPWSTYATSITKAVVTVKNAVSTEGWFRGCSKLTEVNLSGFDTSNVTNMDSMFEDCVLLERLDLSGFNTSNVTTMRLMFSGCESLEELDLGSFNTSKVRYMDGMFYECFKLKTLDLSSFDTANVINMQNMFYYCKSLTELDLSHFNTSKVLNMSHMFQNNSALRSLNVSSFDTTHVAYMNDMFSFCTELTELDVSKWKTVFVTDMSRMFSNCHSLIKLDVSNFDTGYVTNMAAMFAGCIKLEELDIKKFDTAKVTDMSDMFAGCLRLKTLDVSNFDTKHVVNMSSMFFGCSGVESLDVSNFDTAKVTDMYSMFDACESLQTLDVTCFDTSNVSKIDYMFGGCSSLEAIDISGFDFSKVQNANGMFDACNKLDRIKLPANMRVQVAMPVAQMYDLQDKVYSTYFPTDLRESVWLYTENPKTFGNLWVKEIAPQTYTGKAIKPQVQVYSGSKLLQEKVDYTISYKNNTKANDASVAKTAPTITVKGKGNYNKQDTVTFQILAKDIAEEDITVAELVKVQNNKVQKPVPVLTYNGKKLVNKKDFTVSYPDESEENPDAYKAPGIYRILVTGKGNFTGEKILTFTIIDGVLMNSVKIGSIKSQNYTGQQIKPEVKVTYKGKALTPGTDYAVSYSNNVDAGTAAVTVTGKGSYYGTKTATFKITGKSIAKAKVNGISNTTFDGTEKTFVLTVVLGQETLKEGTDYTVSYSNNINAGTATVTVTGKGNYTGIIKKKFKIAPLDFANQELRYISPNSIAYLKGGAKPYFMYFRVNGVGLDEGKDYTLTYKNYNKASVNLGKKKPTIVVKGIGNYKGKVEIEYTIRMKNLQDEDKPITMKAVDVAYSKSKGKYVSKPVLTDYDGKKLVAGVDYEKNPVYTLADGTVLNSKSVVAEGQVITVTVTGKGNYEGTLSTTYTVKPASINAAKVKIDAQVYTGREIKLDQDDFDVKVGKDSLTYGEDYEIVSYSNNLKKGTASVTIRGINSYGGEKTVKFKIVAKEMIWFWKLFE